jgi:tRNA pseudouridine55 synthase
MIEPVRHIETANFLEGALLLVDKPKGWTSFDVVNKVRWLLRKKLQVKKIKVGHSGTLDPMATGLLLICSGKWTKKLNELQGLGKVYTGTITLGGETPSFDAETEVINEKPIDLIDLAEVKKAIGQFIGEIDQVPPIYSAIKVDGKRLYKSARAGKEVKPEPRRVMVEEFEVTRFELPEVDFEVRCSKGTYVRSLAHDLGQALGCGGYLSALRRTAVGPYLLRDAFQISELVEKLDVGDKQNTTI